MCDGLFHAALWRRRFVCVCVCVYVCVCVCVCMPANPPRFSSIAWQVTGLALAWEAHLTRMDALEHTEGRGGGGRGGGGGGGGGQGRIDLPAVVVSEDNSAPSLSI